VEQSEVSGVGMGDFNLPLIYKITSPAGKIYIGQSWDWISRKSKYKKLECESQIYLYRSLKKYGIDNHKIEILLHLPLSISQNILDFYEVYFWQYYKDLGFEMLNIKFPGSNGKHSEESKKKMSMSRSGEKNVMYSKFGKDHGAFGNEGYWKNWKEKGLKHPNLGKVGELSPCFGRTGNKHPMFGKTKGNSPFAKKVINSLTKEIYLSAKDASEKLNINYGILTRSLRIAHKNNRRKLTHLTYLEA
jgi:group I intron endonuclease